MAIANYKVSISITSTSFFINLRASQYGTIFINAMKVLSYCELGATKGGKTVISPCGDSLVGLGLDVTGLIITVLSIGSGPIGWAVMGTVYGGLFMGGLSFMSVIKNCL